MTTIEAVAVGILIGLAFGYVIGATITLVVIDRK